MRPFITRNQNRLLVGATVFTVTGATVGYFAFGRYRAFTTAWCWDHHNAHIALEKYIETQDLKNVERMLKNIQQSQLHYHLLPQFLQSMTRPINLRYDEYIYGALVHNNTEICKLFEKYFGGKESFKSAYDTRYLLSGRIRAGISLETLNFLLDRTDDLKDCYECVNHPKIFDLFKERNLLAKVDMSRMFSRSRNITADDEFERVLIVLKDVLSKQEQKTKDYIFDETIRRISSPETFNFNADVTKEMKIIDTLVSTNPKHICIAHLCSYMPAKLLEHIVTKKKSDINCLDSLGETLLFKLRVIKLRNYHQGDYTEHVGKLIAFLKKNRASEIKRNKAGRTAEEEAYYLDNREYKQK